jgi:excisionase family DNA binding protein
VTRLSLTLPPDALEAIAQRAAEILAQQIGNQPTSPYLNVDEAAAYLRCSRQAIYDRVSQRALEPARDGRRLLFHRDQLDAYLQGRVTA